MAETPLSAAGEGAPERAEREFVGTVLAAAVHEMNNRLATLQESVGLLGDLLGAVKGAKGDAVKDALRAASGVEEQVGSAGSLLRHLGGFADALRGRGPVDLSRAVEEILALTDRLARQRRVRVARDLAAGVPPLAADPAALRHLVHRLVTEAAERCEPQAGVRVRTLGVRGRGGVRVSPAVSPDEETKRVAAAAGAQLEETAEGVTAWFDAAG